MKSPLPARTRRRLRTMVVLWLCLLAVLATVTGVWPRAGKVGALLASFAMLPILAGVGLAVGGHRFHAAVRHHRRGEARLPRSRLATTALILAVVMVSALVLAAPVGLLVLVANAVGDRLGDIGIAVGTLLLGPALTAALVGLFVLALRSARLTALFVALAHPAPWASPTDEAIP